MNVLVAAITKCEEQHHSAGQSPDGGAAEFANRFDIVSAITSTHVTFQNNFNIDVLNQGSNRLLKVDFGYILCEIDVEMTDATFVEELDALLVQSFRGLKYLDVSRRDGCVVNHIAELTRYGKEVAWLCGIIRVKW